MDVILNQDVEHVGDKNDMVTVKSGFGRNYLIPQGLAMLATPSAKKMHAENVKQRAHKEKAIIDEAKAIATKLEASKVKVIAKVGETGKIFGSVTSVQVAEAFVAAGFAIERKNLKIHNEPIKTVGTYKVTVKLHKEVITEAEFEVAGE
jgi:large subunit ribosomal protein L9|tara:strand:+ start:3808 stop:4254 length:447 start_codon:yes stop_codon:yes gene_type:complete